jgi:hypothetical protein
MGGKARHATKHPPSQGRVAEPSDGKIQDEPCEFPLFGRTVNDIGNSPMILKQVPLNQHGVAKLGADFASNGTLVSAS